MIRRNVEVPARDLTGMIAVRGGQNEHVYN